MPPCSLLILLGLIGANALQLAAPSLRHASAARRAPAVLCGFEIEDVSEKQRGEMGVFSWPGLEKRLTPFTQLAAADEAHPGSWSPIRASRDTQKAAPAS